MEVSRLSFIGLGAIVFLGLLILVGLLVLVAVLVARSGSKKPVQAVQAPVNPQQRKEILEALAAGTITQEEAEGQLDAFHAGPAAAPASAQPSRGMSVGCLVALIISLLLALLLPVLLVLGLFVARSSHAPSLERMPVRQVQFRLEGMPPNRQTFFYEANRLERTP